MFYHSGYYPQYYPAQHEDDPRSADNHEYLAVGRDWASEEAMEQLGVVPKDTKDGRVYLSATTTYVSWGSNEQ